MYCGRALPREPLGRKGAPGDERPLAEQIGILKRKSRIHLKKRGLSENFRFSEEVLSYFVMVFGSRVLHLNQGPTPPCPGQRVELSPLPPQGA
jgi:hypothetical protein